MKLRPFSASPVWMPWRPWQNRSRSVALLGVLPSALWLAASTAFLLHLSHRPLVLTGIRILDFLSVTWLLSALWQRERALEHRRVDYQNLLKTLLDPVLIHVDGVVVDANAHAVRVLQAGSRENLVGRSIYEFVRPDEHELVQTRVEHLRQGRSTELQEEHFITCQGEERDVEVAGIPVQHQGRHAVLAIFRDITERKRHQQALADSERRLRALIDGLPDLICLIDEDGRWIEANQTLLQSAGIPENQFRGKTTAELADLCHPSHRASFLRLVRLSAGLPGEVTHTPFAYERPRGGTQLLDIVRVPIWHSDGTPMGQIVIARDVTDQRAAEETLIRSERLAAVGQLAAGFAHEIRNPLTALKGFVDLIRASGTTRESYTRVMRDELDRIESIVNELLVFSRPTTGTFARTECGCLLDDVVELMSHQALLRNVTLARVHGGDPYALACDRQRLKQVLVNAVKNAMEAMPSGGTVVLGARPTEDGRVALYVRDNGPGIPPDILGRIGEPFFTTKEGGTGLGLLVSRKIVEAHGGQLLIHSVPNGGTEIEVVLPRDVTYAVEAHAGV